MRHPVAIPDTSQSRAEIPKRTSDSRLHNHEPELFHFLNSFLICCAEAGEVFVARPLVLAPERFGLVWFSDWSVEVEPFVDVRFALRDVLYI